MQRVNSRIKQQARGRSGLPRFSYQQTVHSRISRFTEAVMKWRKFLAQYSQGDNALFDYAFVERWGNKDWSPNDGDKKAAAKLHVQMISRVTTQPLDYLEGVEKTALKSVYDLFEHTRTISTAHCEARHFSILAWHVLNTYVRPFTAKWHPVSEREMLTALDTTDDFRADLETLQGLLRRFGAFWHIYVTENHRPPLKSDENRHESNRSPNAGRLGSMGDTVDSRGHRRRRSEGH